MLPLPKAALPRRINDNRRRFSELKNKLKRKNLVAERDSLVWLASGVETSART
jgi:hypothetical protein